MRLFIAVTLPEEIKEEIGIFQKELKRKIKEAKIVLKDNLHLTLKFLGEVREEKVTEICEIIGKITCDFTAFPMEIKGIGRFPEGKKIRVLWVGAIAGENLKKLNRIIEDKFEKLNFPKEERFKEHITVARFKTTPNISFVEEFEKKYNNKEWGKIEVSSIELIKSQLTPQGPIYTSVKNFKLGGKNG